MSVNVNPNSNAFKFKGQVDFDTGFGAVVYDDRIKAGDIVLWAYADAGSAQTPYMLLPLVQDGEVWFYPGSIFYDPGASIVRVVFIVFDGTRIPN